ncbi:MAG: 30S ribosomal protein S16 [bacterium]|nr:30S ribosomal protein S16 [bacterium]
MLKIKLARFGKKKQPHYRIVVNEAKDKRDGQYVALLGQYAPTQVPKILNLDLAAYNEWLTKGAQPTETVAVLAKRAESGTPFPTRDAKPSKKVKARAAADAAAAKDAAVAPAEPEKAPEPVSEPAAAAEPTEVAEPAA